MSALQEQTLPLVDRRLIVGGLDPMVELNFGAIFPDGRKVYWRTVTDPKTPRKAEYRVILKFLRGAACAICRSPDPRKNKSGKYESVDNLDHLNGNRRDNRFANFAGLTHQSCNAIRYQTAQAKAVDVAVKVSYAEAHPTRDASLEDVKSESYLYRFRREASAWFKANPGPQPEPVFIRAMVGACAFTDETGARHEPSGRSTIKGYISDRIYPDNPNGVFAYQDGKLVYVGKGEPV